MKRVVLLLLSALVSVFSSNAANIYFVSVHPAENTPSTAAANNGFTNAPDIAYTRLLRNSGHNVVRVLSADNFNVNQLIGADLVIISRSVVSGHYQQTNETSAWNSLPVPTIILGAYVLRGGTTAGNVRLGYFTGATIPDTDGPIRLTALVPTHPIFAGIPLDGANTMVNTYATSGTNGGTLVGPNPTNGLQRGISVITSPIAGGGTLLARVAADLNTANGLIVGEWQAGAVLDTAGRGGGATNDVLGGRRLVFLTGTREFGGVSADGAGIFDLTADGARMFLNAVNYMTGTNAPTRLVTVNTTNNVSPGVGETSLLEALTDVQNGDFIGFDIPGAGPHVIVTPIGGYPPISAHNVTIDGYTQPGASANTRAILAGNNAVLRIVLDSSGTETGENPGDPSLPLHRSTRLLYPGFGDTEDAILPVVGATNFQVKGISFASRYALDEDFDPNVYCVAFVNVPTPAIGGHVNGCWFGLRPDGVSLRGGRASVATFQNGASETARGLVIGTDGDGFGDRAEFNIHAAMSLANHLQVSDVRTSGNYVNVLPSGTNFVDVAAVALEIGAVQNPMSTSPPPATVEFYENANATNVIIGTDGNGVADADERNIVAHVNYSEVMEFWREAKLVVVAGNYFGVGVDGVTASPLSPYQQPDFMSLRSGSSVRIGSNGDGVSDDLEGNIIFNLTGNQYVRVNGPVLIATRRNRMMNNSFPAVPFADGENGRSYMTYYLPAVADSSMVVPVLKSFSNNIVTGMMTGPNGSDYIAAFIDLYTADPAALANPLLFPAPMVHPSRWLAAFTDNGPGDLDPAVNQFAFDVTSFGLADTNYVTLAVTYSKDADSSNAGRAVTSPLSNPVSRRPTLILHSVTGTAATLSWLAYQGAYHVQHREVLDSGPWQNFTTPTYAAGRNIAEVPLDPFHVSQFFRLISP